MRTFDTVTNALLLDRSIQQSYGTLLANRVNNPEIAYDTTTSDISTYYYFANNWVNSAQPLDLRSFADGTYKICVVAKDLKGNGGDIQNQRGAECKTVHLQRFREQFSPERTCDWGVRPMLYA